MFHVKHHDLGQDSTIRDSLAAAAQSDLDALGVDIPHSVVSRCIEYLLEVLSLNESVNVTAITDPVEAVRLHVVDSLAVLPEVRAAPSGTLCDFGSGGGFPGVPIALASGRETTLIDSAKRKVGVMGSALTSAEIRSVRACHNRVEQYVADPPFAVVLSRAVAELPVLVEYATPLLAHGGVFLALKGAPADQEVLRGRSAAELCGLTLAERREYALPRGGERRTVFSFKKTGPSSLSLPRRAGRATKSPLA